MLDSGTLTPLLKRLESLGLVLRRRSQVDEREVHLGLTDSGWALRQQVAPLKDKLLCASGIEMQELDGLRDSLGGLLQRLISLG